MSAHCHVPKQVCRKLHGDRRAFLPFDNHLHGSELQKTAAQERALLKKGLLSVQHGHSDVSISAKNFQFLLYWTYSELLTTATLGVEGRANAHCILSRTRYLMCGSYAFPTGPPGSPVLRIFVSRSIGRERTIDRYAPRAGLLIRTGNAPSMLDYCR
jgi:hypothetical protein